jgi:hypothetical protein
MKNNIWSDFFMKKYFFDWLLYDKSNFDEWISMKSKVDDEEYTNLISVR